MKKHARYFKVFVPGQVKALFEWELRKPIEGQRISLLLTGRAVSNANPRFSTGGALLVKVNGII